MEKALSGIRILDMTHVQAGPTASQLLAWLGADVIKFEPPTGDVTRGQLRDVPDADSLYFTMLNCNKRSITVNMKNPVGKEVFIGPLKKSDVVMENFGPGVLDRLGFSWQQIPDEQVSLLSRDMTLCPGDVIACGTSLGVGSIKDSATVEIEIDRIGVLSNRLAANAVMEAISR